MLLVCLIVLINQVGLLFWQMWYLLTLHVHSGNLICDNAWNNMAFTSYINFLCPKNPRINTCLSGCHISAALYICIEVQIWSSRPMIWRTATRHNRTGWSLHLFIWPRSGLVCQGYTVICGVYKPIHNAVVSMNFYPRNTECAALLAAEFLPPGNANHPHHHFSHQACVGVGCPEQPRILDQFYRPVLRTDAQSCRVLYGSAEAKARVHWLIMNLVEECPWNSQKWNCYLNVWLQLFSTSLKIVGNSLLWQLGLTLTLYP